MAIDKNSRSKWQFANIEELVDYIANSFDIEPLSKQSIRGTGSQVRKNRKTRAGPTASVQQPGFRPHHLSLRRACDRFSVDQRIGPPSE